MISKPWWQIRPIDLEDQSFADWLDWQVRQLLKPLVSDDLANYPRATVATRPAELTRSVLEAIAQDYPDRADVIAATEQSLIANVICNIQSRARN